MAWIWQAVLFLGEEGAHLCLFKGRNFLRSFHLSTPERLLILLRRLRLFQVRLVLNPLNLHTDYIPFKQGGWRDKLSLKRHFFVRQGKDKTYGGVRQYQHGMSFFTVKESPVLGAWLSALQTFPLAVRGCYLFPLEAKAIVDFISAPSLAGEREVEWTVVITRHGGYVRHSVFDNTRFYFTRYTIGPLPEQDAEGFTKFYSQLIATTCEHLIKIYGANKNHIRLLALDTHPLSSIVEQYPLACVFSLARIQNSLQLEKRTLYFIEPLFATVLIRQKRPLMEVRCWKLASNRWLYRRSLIIRACFLGGLMGSLLFGGAQFYPSYPVVTDKKALKLGSSQRPSERGKRSLQQSSPASLSSSLPFRIQALIYRSDSQWAFWLNGKRYTPDSPLPNFKVHTVSAHSIKGLWCQDAHCREAVLPLILPFQYTRLLKQERGEKVTAEEKNE